MKVKKRVRVRCPSIGKQEIREEGKSDLRGDKSEGRRGVETMRRALKSGIPGFLVEGVLSVGLDFPICRCNAGRNSDPACDIESQARPFSSPAFDHQGALGWL